MQQPNPYQPTYGELAFGSSGVPPASGYRIAQLATDCRRICTVEVTTK
jgi:hypothetical protein